jgi:hypothetical protein
MSEKINSVFAGVWIDHSQALIIQLVDAADGQEFRLAEKVASPGNRGGGGEHTINNSSKGDLHKYLKNVSDHLSSFQEIYIFGPGTSQEQLLHHLEADHRFNKSKVSIGKADRMTEGQMIAKVREYFKHRLV